jgi:hypothetical protein
MTWRCVVAAVALSIANTAMAQPPRAVPSNTGDQIQFFRAVLHQLGARPVTQFEELENDPKSKLLIVLGSTEELESAMPGDRLRQFLAAGGSVMIATDRATSDHLFRQVGAQIGGQLVTGYPSESYRGMLTECPIVRRFRPPGPAGREIRHPIFDALPPNAQVATNRPSVIGKMNGLTPVATIRSPGGGFTFTIGTFEAKFPNEFLVGACRQTALSSRLLVLADHSIFIDMMMQPDNHNLEFTFGVARWLMDDSKRTDVLLMENGKIHDSFDVTLTRMPTPPLPPIEALLPLISQRVAALERENVINRVIQQSVEHSTIMRLTLLGVTFGFMAYGAFRFLNIRQRLDARPKKAERSISEEIHLGETARELALATFLDLGQDARTPGAVPVFMVRAGWREGRSWRKQIRRLWDIAVRSDQPISAAELRRVHADLLELRAAATAGVVQFPTAS